MLTVSGYIDGVSYRAVLDGDPVDEPVGCVTDATPDVVPLLRAHEGETFAPTATGTGRKLDLGDPESVYVALGALTQVTGVEGDVPDVTDDPFDPGVVY